MSRRGAALSGQSSITDSTFLSNAPPAHLVPKLTKPKPEQCHALTEVLPLPWAGVLRGNFRDPEGCALELLLAL